MRSTYGTSLVIAAVLAAGCGSGAVKDPVVADAGAPADASAGAPADASAGAPADASAGAPADASADTPDGRPPADAAAPGPLDGGADDWACEQQPPASATGQPSPMYTSDFEGVGDWGGWQCGSGLGCYLAPNPHALTVYVNASNATAVMEKALDVGSHNIVTGGVKHNASSSIQLRLQVRKGGSWHEAGIVAVPAGSEFQQIAFLRVRENPQLVGFTDLRLYPASGQSGVQVQFDYLSAHNDGHLYPEFFAFQTAGDTEGWDAVNSDVTVSASGGSLALEVTDGSGDSPAISNKGLCVRAEDAPVVFVRFVAPTCGSEARLSWRKSGQTWSTSRRVAFRYPQSNSMHLVRIPLRDHPQWTGTVFELKFEPNVDQPGCDMAIDYVALADDRPAAMADLRSSFAADSDGWTGCASSGITIHTAGEGAARLTASQTTACMENTSLSPARDAQGLVDIRFVADRTAMASVYWQASDATAFDSDHKLSFLVRGSTGYQTKRLDLRSHPNFSGAGKLRIVFPKAANSSVWVDHVAVHANGDADLGKHDYRPDSDGGKFRLVQPGQVQPTGWIKEAIGKDLEPGLGMAGSQHMLDWRTDFDQEQDYYQRLDRYEPVCYTWQGAPSSDPDWPTWAFCNVPSMNFGNPRCYAYDNKRGRSHGYGAPDQACRVYVDPNNGKTYLNWGPADFQARWMTGLAQLAIMGDVNQSPWTDAEDLVTDWFENDDYGLLNAASGDYLGIYPSDLRWQKLGTGNVRTSGELLVHVYALLGLLTRYEQAPVSRGNYLAVATAVADNIMTHYNHASPYFKEAVAEVDGGGGSWGLQMVEVMAHLYRLTGDPKYREYAVYLYEDFSRAEGVVVPDYRLPVLLSKEASGDGFNDHGVHVGAFLKFPVWMARHVHDPRLRKGADIAMATVQQHLSPGGGLTSDEHVRNRPGHPDLTTEFSGTLRTMESLFDAFRLTGRVELADLAERSLFNAVLGAVDLDWQAASYFPRDNFTNACGEWPGYNAASGRYLFKWDSTKDYNSFTRFSPSPVVKDTSVDTPHILPTYIKALWLRAEADDPGFVLGSYGPSQINTTFNGAPISIEEDTNYPFLEPGAQQHVQLSFSNISGSQPATLWLRVPEWARDMTVTVSSAAGDARVWDREGFKLVHASWTNNDTISIKFIAGVVRQRSFASYDTTRTAYSEAFEDRNGSTPGHQPADYPAKYWLSYGPLVFALPLTHAATLTPSSPPQLSDTPYLFRQFLDSRFNDACYRASESLRQQLSGSNYAVVWDASADLDEPWSSKPLRIDLLTRLIPSSQNVQDSLYPMGGEIMRLVGFESLF